MVIWFYFLPFKWYNQDEKGCEIMQILESRKAIRTYDPTVKITREDMLSIIKLATLAPSSMNMQPWRFFIV